MTGLEVASFSLIVVKTDMCSADGSVNTTVIDQACQQIENISQMYPTWMQLYANCLSRLNWLVNDMLLICQNIKWIPLTKSCKKKDSSIRRTILSRARKVILF